MELNSDGGAQHEQSRGRCGLRGVCKINPVSPLWLCTGNCDQIEEPEQASHIGDMPGDVAWCGIAGKKLDSGNLRSGILPKAFHGTRCRELFLGELRLVGNQ